MSAMSDIALLLLIFFVVTTQFLQQRSVKAEIPAIDPEKEEEELPTKVVVSEGSVLLDGEEISLEQLAPFLASKLADKTAPEDRAVILDGRDTVRFERLIETLVEIKRAGGIVIFHDDEQNTEG